MIGSLKPANREQYKNISYWHGSTCHILSSSEKEGCICFNEKCDIDGTTSYHAYAKFEHKIKRNSKSNLESGGRMRNYSPV